MRTKRDWIREACLNNYGYFDASVGTDIATRLYELNTPKNAITAYLRVGWLRRVGTGLLLTKKWFEK
jgi:hypothetical protein